MKNIVNTILRFLESFRRPSKAGNLRKLRERGETIDSFNIREVTVADLAALTALHVQAWNETYWNVQHKPSHEIREQQWSRTFTIRDGSWFCFVIEDHAGKLVGFVKGSRYASEDLPDFSGELKHIYLLQDYQRLGLGSLLMEYAAERFISMGINSMVLFSTPQNPSCLFYDAVGGEKLYAKNGEFHGGYGWRDLPALLRD
ncbi:MAG: GNAT family N-acetyltransferase [Chitinophagaceae bacterium]